MVDFSVFWDVANSFGCTECSSSLGLVQPQRNLVNYYFTIEIEDVVVIKAILGPWFDEWLIVL